MAEKDNFDPKAFVDQQTSEVRKALGHERAVIACSGGVDSTTCAVLTKRAVGENLICVFIDTNFMRLNEPETVVKTISSPPLGLPVKLIRAQDRFMKALEGLEDAEEKRKAFRNTFYSVLHDVAEKEKCHFLVQGTILPDIIETVKGIKTQHNVLEQLKIDTQEVYGFKLVEPLVSLYKFQVREVARGLGIPLETSERQPFPGPGLSVRVVGKITPEKLDVEKKTTKIVEERLEKLKPKQYFPAIIDSARINYPKTVEMEEAVSGLLKGRDVKVKAQALRTRATGIKGGARLYGRIITATVRDENEICVELPKRVLEDVQKKIIEINGDVSRVLYRLTDPEQRGKWVIAVRSVETLDFVTAAVSNIPWHTLREVGELVLNSCKDIATVYYDITPKPPASIEFE